MRLFKRLIRYILNSQNIFAERSIEKIKLIDFIKLFKIKIPSNVDLIRIGSSHDGGYLVPNILEKINFCFSAGVGGNIEFEKDLLKYKIKSFGADSTVDGPPEIVNEYTFLKKNINTFNDNQNITFEKWIKDQNIYDENLIGQIDIEGDEYNLILSTPSEILKKFKILIFEFHYIHKIQDKIIYNLYVSAFKKILKDFNICHLHINNAEKQSKIRNIEIPHLLEVTFLNKNCYSEELKKATIPHILDNKNIPSKDNVNFDKNWLDIIIQN